MPSGITAGDFNGDGQPNLVIAKSGSDSRTILLNTGASSFMAARPVSLGTASLMATYAEEIPRSHRAARS
jgi:hypothetical protein